MGHAGEREFGYHNFMELFSVFSSPPLVSVYYGQSEIGQVHELTFQLRDEDTVLTPRAAGWSAISIGRVDGSYVEPTDLARRSRWVVSTHTWALPGDRRGAGALNPRSIARSAQPSGKPCRSPLGGESRPP
jgi:hypothetical protein